MPTAPRASAILCTLNRGPKIRETVDSLLAQHDVAGGFEILIVDNASSPANAAVLRDLAAAHPERIRYELEPVVGESSARNRAIHTARGRYLAFLDDDAVAPPEWLGALLAPFEAGTAVGGTGGPIRLRYEEPPPAWVDADFTPFLSAFDAGGEPIDLHYPDYPRGANMAFDREVFAKAGDFSLHYGRKADCLLSYSETEMYYRVERAGFRVVYAPDAWVDHIVAPGRCTPEWFHRRIHWQGRSMGRFEVEHDGRMAVLARAPRQFAKWLLRPAPHRARHAGWLLGAAAAFLGR